jgi:hypothetical protein
LVSHKYSSWAISFGLPAGQSFETGEYFPTATSSTQNSQYAKPIRYGYDSRLRVWELQTTGSPGGCRLAIDFILHYKPSGETAAAGGDRVVVGMYRWRSTYE